jgi:hypothetical protein
MKIGWRKSTRRLLERAREDKFRIISYTIKKLIFIVSLTIPYCFYLPQDISYLAFYSLFRYKS